MSSFRPMLTPNTSKTRQASPNIAHSNYRIEWTTTGLTIYKPVLSVGGRPKPRETRVAGMLLRRQGIHETVLAVTASGGAAQQTVDTSDEIVLDGDYFPIVKHFAKQLRMSMAHIYDTSGGTRTIEENGEY